MAQLALDGLDVDLEDYEVHRSEPSFAIDTVTFLKHKYPDTTFTWVIGSDALSNLQTWKEIDQLAKEITFLVVARPGHAIDLTAIHSGVNWSAIEISAPDISATEIRKAILEGRDIREWIPERVLAFIEEKGLYGAA